MALPRTATGEVCHPSGATRPPHLVALGPTDDPGHARAAGTRAESVLRYLLGLVLDPSTGLSNAQQTAAAAELEALAADAHNEASMLDPAAPDWEITARAAESA